MSTYRERREAKATRLEEWADKREATATAVFEANKPYTNDYAFNSQPGHISARARIIKQEDKQYESLRKADEMRSRAENIKAAADKAIYGDDHDAIEKLQERIADLEAQRERIKAYNKSCKKGVRDVTLLDDEQQKEIITIVKVQAFQCPNGAFPAYVSQNLGGNINRNKKRLAQLQEGAA